MKVLIDIPNYEFDNDVKDKFQDYFKRVKQDIADGTLCGNYELETTDMFLASFERLQILPDNLTSGDMIKAMFPLAEVKEKNNGYEVYFGIGTAIQYFNHQWWNALYKRGRENG